MNRITLIQTAPRDVPGSMIAYADSVVRSLALCGGDELDVRVCELFDPRGGADMWRHHVWRMKNARRVLSADAADLFHLLDGSMSAFVPRAMRANTVAMVHDLIPLLQWRGELPGRRPSFAAAWIIRRGARALGQFAGLCCNSDWTRRDVTRLTGISKNMTVIPLIARDLPDPEPIPGFAMPERFIFHVGTNADYKNRAGVLNVFARLQHDQSDLHLLMAGASPTPELQAMAAGIPRVHFVGPVGDAQLHGLYQRAAFLLFPSRYEGFGMPVLEAMRCGCPVICSTNGALPEVAGDAALSAAADDLDALAAHGRALLADAALRARMIERGRAHAANFNLSVMGRSLVGWYKLFLGRR